MKATNLTHQEIAQQAYQIYVRSGCKHGHAEEHWLQAESELRRMMSDSETKTANAPPKAAAASNGSAKAGSGKPQPAPAKAASAGKKAPKSAK